MKKTQKKIWKNTIKNLKKSKMKPHLLFDHYSPLRGFTLSSVHRSEEKKRNTISLLVLSPFVVHRSLRSLVAKSLVSPEAFSSQSERSPTNPTHPHIGECSTEMNFSLFDTEREKITLAQTDTHSHTLSHSDIHTHM